MRVVGEKNGEVTAVQEVAAAKDTGVPLQLL